VVGIWIDSLISIIGLITCKVVLGKYSLSEGPAPMPVIWVGVSWGTCFLGDFQGFLRKRNILQLEGLGKAHQ